jgi:hypothetical protein
MLAASRMTSSRSSAVSGYCLEGGSMSRLLDVPVALLSAVLRSSYELVLEQ